MDGVANENQTHTGPRRSRWILAVVVVLIVAGAATVFFTREGGPKAYASASELVERLNEEGVTCTKPVLNHVQTSYIGQKVSYDYGHCRIPSDDDVATIWVFTSERDASIVRSEFGVRGRWIVGDTNWNISAPSRAAQKSIQRAIGGGLSSNY